MNVGVLTERDANGCSSGSQLRNFVPTARTSSKDTINAALHVSRHIGISQDTEGEVSLRLGRKEAVVVIDVASRHIVGVPRSPNSSPGQGVQLREVNEVRLDHLAHSIMM